MLVDPVGHEARLHPPVPPGLAVHLLLPGAGDVPVVADVVIVDHHRGRNGREQPADVRLAPRFVIQAGVLLEVEHLLARRLGDVAARADELAGFGRSLVDVDLVAEHQQQVRPAIVGVAHQLVRVHVERVDLGALVVLVLRVDVWRLHRQRHAAGAERDAQRPSGIQGADLAGGKLRVRHRPAALAVQADLVLES